MSLFRVRDFWSFDLDQLQYHTDNSQPNQQHQQPDHDAHSSSQKCTDGSFIMSLGRFQAIGDQDVFVCGNLDGQIYIIQVPLRSQLKFKQSEGEDQPIDTSTDRQLLAACRLSMPIIDLKCGYFNSALKQTIAVLTFDKLILFQVKKRQVDLLSGDSLGPDNFQESQTINENLLSHELDEIYRIELLSDEFASSILVLDSHADSCLISESHSTSENLSLQTNKPSKFAQKTKQIVQQLHLPQRDKIIVQYTNQFLFTLVESKKIIGHYYMRANCCSRNKFNSLQEQEGNPNEHENAAPSSANVSEFVGPMPMAYLYSVRSSPALVVSLSDYKIYCLPLDKLVNQAKQNIMKRVAQNLLIDGKSQMLDPQISGKQPAPSMTMDSQGQGHSQLAKVWLDLDSFVEWEQELVQAPIQLVAVQRRARDIISTSQQDEINLSQLLVMSRYSLDLFSPSGSHLWSLRFETPLMYVHCYTIDKTDTLRGSPDLSSGPSTSRQKLQFNDKLISLVCTNSLNNETSNLIILEEDQFVWSALLNCKPIQLMRANLNKMSGFLVSLDNNQSQLTASYLGTNNNEKDAPEVVDEFKGDQDDVSLANLSQLDEQMTDRHEDEVMFDGSRTNLLVIETKLEQAKSNQWPNISIDCQLSVRPDASSTSVLHNMILTLEFDDLLRFDQAPRDELDPIRQQQASVNKGIVQVSLGNCWPDRREPILFRGTFSLSSSMRLRGTNAIEQLDNDNQLRVSHEQQLLPKSLQVRLVVRFNEARLGQLCHEESFLLPLNLISQLTHLDFSIGQGQDLADVLNNLNQYKRLSDVNQNNPYYVCDLFLKVNGDILDLVDAIIEDDLICRGQSQGTSSLDPNKSSNERRKKLTTLENINLLAQSLDCRLRYKSPTSNGPELTRQESEEFVLPVIITIALKVSQTSSIFKARDETTNPETIVWIHICDLATKDSNIPQDLVKLHANEWKKYSISGRKAKPSDELKDNTDKSMEEQQGNPILISIECEQPLPVLFYQTHLIERLKKGQPESQRFNLDLMALIADDNSTHIDHQILLRCGNFTAISSNLHDKLKSTLNMYNEKLKSQFKRLKDELSLEYCKFNIATMTSLSLAKKLHNLPENIGQQQFESLSLLTKRYQMNLVRILTDLEAIQKLDYEFSKIPSATNLKIEDGNFHDGNYREWPDFVQIIN